MFSAFRDQIVVRALPCVSVCLYVRMRLCVSGLCLSARAHVTCACGYRVTLQFRSNKESANSNELERGMMSCDAHGAHDEPR